MKDIELKIPNLGEAEETEIIEISVKQGDKVSLNDPLIVLESEKAAMEVPSDYDGVIKQIMVNEGDSVKEGNIFAVIEVTISEHTNEDHSDADDKTLEITPSNHTQSKKEVSQIINLSGINAGPAVRKVARELEIDLSKIIGTGRNSMITKDDLKNFIHSLGNVSKASYADLDSLKDFGDYEVENQTKIKKAGAKNLTNSWQSIPHVCHFEEADITNIELQRSELNKKSKVKITPLAYFSKIVSKALKEFPLMNSSLVGDGKLMLKKYINIGIAVSTEQGLVVPNIKNIDSLDIAEIADHISILSNKAREKKLLKDDITGATFTISSLGNIGGIGFSPIINPPEVGIIGISRTKKVILSVDGKFAERTYLPFSLSYDHRVINGVDAGHFMNFIKASLEKGL